MELGGVVSSAVVCLRLTAAADGGGPATCHGIQGFVHGHAGSSPWPRVTMVQLE